MTYDLIMDLETAVRDGFDTVVKILTKDKVDCGKIEQVEAVASLFSGRDTVCVLPTGYGKSMIFFTLTGIYNILDGVVDHKLKKTSYPLVLVVSPLLSLMAVHVKEATSMGLVAVQLPAEDGSSVDLSTVDIIIASPEYLTGEKGIQLVNSILSRVIVLVTDEVHVVPKW